MIGSDTPSMTTFRLHSAELQQKTGTALRGCNRDPDVSLSVGWHPFLYDFSIRLPNVI